MKSISLIIPTYNDEKIIKEKIIFLLSKLRKKKFLYEVIIVDDGSTDSTYSILKKLKLKNFKLLKNKFNFGKSYSIRKALRITKYDYIVLIDSDLPYFNVFNEVIDKLNKNYDFVFVNRKHKHSKLINANLDLYQLVRHTLGYLVSLSIRIFLGFNLDGGDTQAGLKGFKKIKQFRKLKFISKKFFLDLEIMFYYNKHNKNFFSIPVEYKISNSSSIKIFSIKKNFFILIELIKVINVLKSYFFTHSKKQ